MKEDEQRPAVYMESRAMAGHGETANLESGRLREQCPLDEK